MTKEKRNTTFSIGICRIGKIFISIFSLLTYFLTLRKKEIDFIRVTIAENVHYCALKESKIERQNCHFHEFVNCKLQAHQVFIECNLTQLQNPEKPGNCFSPELLLLLTDIKGNGIFAMSNVVEL